MEFCLAMGLDPADRLWVRISEQTKVDNPVVGVCYRPHNQEEIDEAFFHATGRSLMFAGPGLLGAVQPP